jgi:hypothetical protein
VNLVYWFLVILTFLLAGIKTEKPKKISKGFSDYSGIQ